MGENWTTMKMWRLNVCSRFIALASLAVILAGCSMNADEGGINVFSHTFDFNSGISDWKSGFADFPVKDSAAYQFETDYTYLPSGLDASRKAIMMSGNNVGGSLFMYVARKVTGLSPNTDYAIVFDVELASNAAKGRTDQGAPGEDVFLKAGATGMEPKAVIDDKMYAFNADKGPQNGSGENTVMLGNIATSKSNYEYQLITRTNSGSKNPFIVKSNSKGELWLVVGADSSYKGVTRLYYARVSVIFSTTE